MELIDSSILPTLVSSLDISAYDSLRGKNLVVILSGIRHRDEVYIQLHRVGVNVYILDRCLPFWAEKFTTLIECANPEEYTCASAALATYVSTHGLRVDGVTTFDEYGVVCAAKLAIEYKLPGIPIDTVNAIKNKYCFRVYTNTDSIISPQVLLLPHTSLASPLSAEFEAQLDAFPYPCVLKPLAGAGSYFVQRVYSKEEVLEVVRKHYHNAAISGVGKFWLDDVPAGFQVSTKDTWFMLESMIVGQEVDIDLVVQNGDIKFLGIADNRPSEGPKELFMEAGGDQPTLLPESKQQQLIALTKHVISSFGTDLNGVFHFEAIVNEQGAGAIELNLRLGGSEVLAMIWHVYGVHLGLEAAKVACNIPVNNLNVIPKKQCASTNVLAKSPGMVTRTGVDKAVWQVQGAVGAQVRTTVGRKILAPPLGYEYVGWAVGSSDVVGDYVNARKSLAEVTKHLICDIEPDE